MAVEQRQRQHVEVAAGGIADEREPGECDGQHEEVDGDEVERKDPGRGAQLRLGAVLHDHHVELPGQHDDGEAAERGEHQPGAERRAVVERCLRLAIGGERVDQPLRTVEQEEGDEYADREEGRQLDDGFDRDSQHQPVLMLGGVGMTGAEQHGEEREQHGDDQRDVADEGIEAERRAAVVLDHQADRAGDRLQLECDVGDGADDGDQRGDRGDGKTLAIARAEEVGDRGDLLGLGEYDDAAKQREAEDEDEHRADVDGEEFEAALGGEADRAEEGPGGAVDGEAERVDVGARARWPAARRPAVAEAGDDEKQRHIGDGYVTTRKPCTRSKLLPFPATLGYPAKAIIAWWWCPWVAHGRALASQGGLGPVLAPAKRGRGAEPSLRRRGKEGCSTSSTHCPCFANKSPSPSRSSPPLPLKGARKRRTSPSPRPAFAVWLLSKNASRHGEEVGSGAQGRASQLLIRGAASVPRRRSCPGGGRGRCPWSPSGPGPGGSSPSRATVARPTRRRRPP